MSAGVSEKKGGFWFWFHTLRRIVRIQLKPNDSAAARSRDKTKYVCLHFFVVEEKNRNCSITKKRRRRMLLFYFSLSNSIVSRYDCISKHMNEKSGFLGFLRTLRDTKLSCSFDSWESDSELESESEIRKKPETTGYSILHVFRMWEATTSSAPSPNNWWEEKRDVHWWEVEHGQLTAEEREEVNGKSVLLSQKAGKSWVWKKRLICQVHMNVGNGWRTSELFCWDFFRES